MFAFDIPDVPHLYAGALVAQSNEARKRLENSERAIGVCFGAHNPPGGEYATALSPQSAARIYFGLFEKKEVDDPPLSNVELLVQPKNGKVVYSKYEDGLLHPTYIPSAGYFGDERIVFQVNVEGKSVRVVYVLKVTKHLTGGQLTNEYFCKRDFWKISTTGDGSWELQDNAILEPGNDTTADTTNSGFPFGPLSSNHEGVRYAGLGSTNADSPYTFNNISVTFASLEGQAVGNAMGVGPAAQITLDADAAGHGWFIDTTPTTNEEFLPTADPTLWQARTDSSAAGKMDMLTVLLHEYGHALGLEHSGTASDFMSAALQPNGTYFRPGEVEARV